ncbi:hypothetical protein SDC9_74038 [bioreactor metagenome]|uniref:Uncharacterized protein n=1 Tax=bioreactor metagenome TaxID=1076179 RepID=A0A644YG95_9ZZZZ
MEDLIILLAFMSPLFLVLTIGGVVADFIFPHIKCINRYINRLPMMQNDIKDDKK